MTVSDPFPAGSFSSIANAGGAGWNCTINGLTLTCSRSDALAGNDAYPPILVDATVADPAPATIVNTATVSGGGSDPASASDGGGANGLADVSLSKTVDRTSGVQRGHGHVHAHGSERRTFVGSERHGQRSDRPGIQRRRRAINGGYL